MGIKQSSKPKRMGRKPKFDYTGEDFLSKISELARKGYTDREIAFSIGLNGSTFSEKSLSLKKLPKHFPMHVRKSIALSVQLF